MTTVLYIIVALLAFGFMIAFHESGHFFAARLCGVKVYEFSLGMGPKIFSKNGKDGTRYSLRLFPIGGFVSMKGEDEDAVGEDSLSEKKPWQKFIIVAAGATMNILLGFLITLGLVLGQNVGTTVIGEFAEGAVSNKWLMVGDEIISVDGTRVHNFDELHYEIIHDGYEPVDIVVIRQGMEITLEDVTFLTDTEQGITYGIRDFKVYRDQKTLGSVLKHTWFKSISTVKMIWESLIDLAVGRVGMDAVSGPVGVTEAIGNAAQSGGYTLFYLLSVLTMNLGVFNLLPFPALDGGRLVFIIYEMIFRRKVPQRFEGAVHFIGIVLLLSLMVFVTFKDIIRLAV